jgi:hypothetical protein
MNEHPCIHYDQAAPRGCRAGRHYPNDCQGCAAYEADAVAALSLDPAERTRCEIWTRVMGYHRPVSAFNPGKQAEHAQRRYFVEGAGD